MSTSPLDAYSHTSSKILVGLHKKLNLVVISPFFPCKFEIKKMTNHYSHVCFNADTFFLNSLICNLYSTFQAQAQICFSTFQSKNVSGATVQESYRSDSEGLNENLKG